MNSTVPAAGGTYIRDPKTGALTRVDDTAIQEGAKPTEPVVEDGGATPAVKSGKQ